MNGFTIIPRLYKEAHLSRRGGIKPDSRWSCEMKKCQNEEMMRNGRNKNEPRTCLLQLPLRVRRDDSGDSHPEELHNRFIVAELLQRECVWCPLNTHRGRQRERHTHTHTERDTDTQTERRSTGLTDASHASVMEKERWYSVMLLMREKKKKRCSAVSLCVCVCVCVSATPSHAHAHTCTSLYSWEDIMHSPAPYLNLNHHN